MHYSIISNMPARGRLPVCRGLVAAICVVLVGSAITFTAMAQARSPTTPYSVVDG
nr:hypothetical protein [Xanthomonas sp. WHRI 8812E]MEA9634256.1 hypothetical protein [Xanthomonas sp. WHRI 8812E]